MIVLLLENCIRSRSVYLAETPCLAFASVTFYLYISCVFSFTWAVIVL